jgi:formylglycine-generating enzyme required for sulfatase activity
MGIDGFPAIMTQHAANKYAEWLSAKLGEFYRLPTEAEWEYACRAGAATAYPFGNDPSKLADYAWYSADSDGKYHQVGIKKPNQRGLYDMLATSWNRRSISMRPTKPGPNPTPGLRRRSPIRTRGVRPCVEAAGSAIAKEYLV